MSESIQAGDKVKWSRVYRDTHVTYYGTVVAIEVGAEIPQAIVQPKGRGVDQRVDYAALLRADDPSQPPPMKSDLPLWRERYTCHCLREEPRLMRFTWMVSYGSL